MLWPVISSLYILAGGALAPLLVRAQPSSALPSGSQNPAAAFAVATGTILLWPVLLALAIAQGGGE